MRALATIGFTLAQAGALVGCSFPVDEFTAESSDAPLSIDASGRDDASTPESATRDTTSPEDSRHAAADTASPPEDTTIDTGPDPAMDSGIDTAIDTTSDPCAPKTTCDGTCVDTTKDNHHCGDCTTVCGGGSACVHSACACPPDKAFCSGACVDTSSDPANCGSCGNDCRPAKCKGGSCGG